MLERSSQQGGQEVAGREPTPKPSAPAKSRNPGQHRQDRISQSRRPAIIATCAVSFFGSQKKPIDLEVAGRKYDPVYVQPDQGGAIGAG